MDDVMKRAVEAVTGAIEEADCGYMIELTKLIDGVHTYSARIYGGPSAEFSEHSDALDWVQGFRRKAKAEAAIRAALPVIAEDLIGKAVWLASEWSKHDDDNWWSDAAIAVADTLRARADALRARLAEMMEG